MSAQSLSKIFADLDGTNSVNPSVRTCHVCLATVSGLRTYCTSCGHPLCKTCTCPIPEGADEAHKAFEDSGGVHLTVRDGDTLTSYNRSVPSSPTKEDANPLATADVKNDLQNNAVQEHDVGESSGHQAIDTTAPPKPRGSKTSSVKDNPFIVADRHTAGGQSASRPANTSHATRRGAAPSECISHRSDNEQIDDRCNDPTCRATHPGHKPYRHSVSCSELRSAHSTDEVSTDNPPQMEHHSPHREHRGHDTTKPVHQEHQEDDDFRHEERHARRAREPVDQQNQHEYGYSSSDRPGPGTRNLQRTETHERYHRHPHSHSPDNGPSRKESHRRREHRAEVRPQERRPRSRIRSPPGWLRGQSDYPDSIDSDRLNEFHAKNGPARADTWRSREHVKSHRSRRPRGSPHRYRANEEIKDEDFRDVRRRLNPSKATPSGQARYSQLPRDTGSRIAHRDAEQSLRKIRSEAKILLSKISEPEDESMETEVRHSGTAKDHGPAGLSVPSSATSLTGETSPERHRLSAQEKGKGKASANAFDQSEPQRPGKPHHSVTRTGHDRRQHDQTSLSARPKPAGRDKGKAKEDAQKQLDMPHVPCTSTQKQSAKSRQPTAERGGEHQCDWKDKYDTLKAEIDESRPEEGFGVDEAGHDHQCDWKDKYLALKPKVEDGQAQQQADLGLEGLTIVLHMRDKDDLVINTDLRELDQ